MTTDGDRRHYRGASLQPALQDYLKAIHRLTEGRGSRQRAATKAIAEELGVTAPSVSAMLDRMATERLVDYVHYSGASLTPRGRRLALQVIRRHRLIELFLVRHLGFGWEEVHAEADLLEHVISERLEAAIDNVMGYPDRDPHGDLIPTANGSLPPRTSRSLWDAPGGAVVKVDRVGDDDTGLLRHFAEIGLVPGATVTVLARESGGALQLKVGRRDRRTIGREAAEQVFVHD